MSLPIDFFNTIQNSVSGGLTGAAAFAANMASNFSADPAKAAASAQIAALNGFTHLPSFTQISGDAQTAVNNMVSNSTSAVTDVTSHVTSQISSLPSTASTVMQSVNIDKQVAAANGQAKPSVCDSVSTFFGTLQKGARDFFNTVTSSITSVMSTVTSLINAITSGITSAINAAISAVNSIASTVNSAISSAISAVRAAMQSEINALTAAVKKIFNFNFAKNLSSMFGHPCTQNLVTNNLGTKPLMDTVNNPATNLNTVNVTPVTAALPVTERTTTELKQATVTVEALPSPPPPGNSTCFYYSPGDHLPLPNVGDAFGVDITYTSAANQSFTETISWKWTPALITYLQNTFEQDADGDRGIGSVTMRITRHFFAQTPSLNTKIVMVRATFDRFVASDFTVLVPIEAGATVTVAAIANGIRVASFSPVQTKSGKRIDYELIRQLKAGTINEALEVL
jgi:hypothetical protein